MGCWLEVRSLTTGRWRTQAEGDADQSNGFFCLRPHGRFWPNCGIGVASSEVIRRSMRAKTRPCASLECVYQIPWPKKSSVSSLCPQCSPPFNRPNDRRIVHCSRYLFSVSLVAFCFAGAFLHNFALRRPLFAHLLGIGDQGTIDFDPIAIAQWRVRFRQFSVDT